MNKLPENLGKPDIKIAGLEIWIHGNQFPDSINKKPGPEDRVFKIKINYTPNVRCV